MRNPQKIIQIDGPTVASLPANFPTTVPTLIYSVQLVSGLVVTSPEGFPVGREESTGSAEIVDHDLPAE